MILLSRNPQACRLPGQRSRLSRSYASNLPSSFSMVLSSALVCSTSPPVSVSGTVLMPALFPGPPPQPPQSDKEGHASEVVTSGGLGNVRPIPIGYGSRPRLRGRLTLRGLTLRRNPWTSGGRGSHSPCRYSCPHSHFRCLQRTSRCAFTGLRNAPLPRIPKDAPTASARGLSPVTFSPQNSY